MEAKKEISDQSRVQLATARFHHANIVRSERMFQRIAVLAKVSRHNGHATGLNLRYVNHRGRMREQHRGINISMYRCLRRLACQRTRKGALAIPARAVIFSSGRRYSRHLINKRLCQKVISNRPDFPFLEKALKPRETSVRR